MRNYEVFNTEQELLDRIQELRDTGYEYSEFEVYTSNELSGDYEYYYDVNQHDGEATFVDKVAAFFTGEDPEERVFGKYDWDESVKEEARRAVDNGQYLLVVDKEGYYDNEENFDYINNPEYKRDNEFMGRTEVERSVDESVLGAGYNENLNATNDRQYDEDLDRHFDDANLSDEERIKLHEERLKVDKNREQTGEVVVEKEIVTEEQEIDVPVTKEKVTIERRPVNGDERYDGEFEENLSEDEIRIPIHEDKITVDKETVVNEEVVIKKEIEEDVETVKDTVRKEHVDINEDQHINNKDNSLFGEDKDLRNKDNSLFGEDDELIEDDKDTLF